MVQSISWSIEVMSSTLNKLELYSDVGCCSTVTTGPNVNHMPRSKEVLYYAIVVA